MSMPVSAVGDVGVVGMVGVVAGVATDASLLAGASPALFTAITRYV